MMRACVCSPTECLRTASIDLPHRAASAKSLAATPEYRVASYKSGGLKRSTQHPSRTENVTRKRKKVKGKRRGRLALVCMSLQCNELRNCD